ncbi:sigma-54 interaction domain-containing protein [Roseivirga sp. 4D4]|uniref:sigma-54 interaction domain-containing protein n=1 Tax=Roseivirga sp. 4D4 TaxID=1889784 RepID=UPI0009F3A815|nr:sigma 54-interacting transcriptional regulator [Roseivirga sp. 4D4]
MSVSNQLPNYSRLSQFTVERALASVFWMEESGSLRFANETAQILYGYSADEFKSLSILDLNPNFDEERFADLWARSKVEKRIRLESTHCKKDGTEFPVEIFVNHIEFEGHAFNVSFVLDITERKRKERLLKSLSEATADAVGSDFFVSLVENIAKSLGVHMAIITECTDSSKSRLRTLAYFKDDTLQENVEYNTEGTPCKLIMETTDPLFIQEGVQDEFEKEPGIEGYFGIPILNDSGDCIGHIAVLNNDKLQLSPEEQDILKLFSDRAAAEIERKIASEKLLEAVDEVKSLKDRLEAENTYLQEEIKFEHNFQEIITQSDRFRSVLSSSEQVAITDATVLILGESGTGKELLARAIHNISKRSDRPLVKVNCAALPANLIESELFGHEKGAFTGAIAKKVGRFELADGGTLFLDEVGELPLELQSKLLRALQEGEFERLGSTNTQKVDVRVIAATNRDLEKEVDDGSFRADLFYRLNVFPIQSIPLRERKEDIPLLVKHFVNRFSAKIGKKIVSIPKRIINSLQGYHWPGNIRELENVIERSVILSSGTSLELGDWIPKSTTQSVTTELDTLHEFERKYIIHVLQKTTWRVSGEKGAAKILGMKPTTLESRMKKLGIKRGFSN